MNKLDVLKQEESLKILNDDWFDLEELGLDGLPKFFDISVGLANPPKLPSKLIEWVFRLIYKMMIVGTSKSGINVFLKTKK